MAPPPLRNSPELLKKDLSGRVYIVTGANSGCGLEISRQLVKQGATVILACRSADRGKEAAKDVKGKFLVPMDLSSLQSVKDFVEAFKSSEWGHRLDGLVNNAGIMSCPYGVTKDNFEMQFGCNHLAHFLLMTSLVDLMIKTSTDITHVPSRFVAVSSCAATKNSMRPTYPDIDIDDLNFEKREYDPMVSYGQSKLCNYMHALEASKRYPSDKLISASVHPGWVNSPLDVHSMARIFGESSIGQWFGRRFKAYKIWTGDIIQPEDGAQSALHCLLADDIQSGKFYSQTGVYCSKERQKGGWPLPLENPNATDEKATALWEKSLELLATKQ